MSDEPDARLYDTRRGFLRATAAAGAVGAGLAAGAGSVAAQETTFRLDGEVSGWTGRKPSSIEGKTNPTLDLEPGTKYAITWKNVDGQPHNVVLGDGNGKKIVRSDIVSEQGKTQTVNFTAKESMSTYYCEVHPSSMKGDVSTGGGSGSGDSEGGSSGPRFIEKGTQVGLKEVASGPLQQPIGFTYADEETDRRFILDQNGYVYVHDSNGIREEPFLDLHDRLHYLTETKGGYPRPEEGKFDERGMLGLAFHPDFADNGKFYVHYSAPPKEEMGDYAGPSGREMPPVVDHTLTISEFTANDDGTSADPKSERVLLEIPEPQFNHNAGDLAFGPDGHLYVTVADGGGANDAFKGHVDDWYDKNDGGNGQDVTTNLLGSILRLDVDSKGENTPYGIPEDNPLVGKDGFDEHYSWGHRNPWRISFTDGKLYVADVGQALYEEVNLVEKGGNYGWNVREGTHCFSVDSPAKPPKQCPASTPDDVRDGQKLSDPVIQYPHTYKGTQVGTSVTGGYVHQGDALSDIGGDYVFADWSRSFTAPKGRLLVSTPNGGDGEDGTWGIRELTVANSPNGQINRFIMAFGRDRDGAVYALTSTEGGVKGQGTIYKLVPPKEGDDVSMPKGAKKTQGTTAGGSESGTQEATEEGAMDDGTATSQGESEAGETTENGGGQPGFGALATVGGIGSAVAAMLARHRDDGE